MIALDFSDLDGQPFDLFVGLGKGNSESGAFLLGGYGLAANEVHLLRRFLDRSLGYVLLWELCARAQSEDEGKRIRRQARRDMPDEPQRAMSLSLLGGLAKCQLEGQRKSQMAMTSNPS